MKASVHPQALCETSSIGEGTRVWAWAHVFPGATVGKECNLCDHVFVENDVVLGDRVTIKSFVHIPDGVTLEDDVFVGPNATFTNDPFPRSKAYLEEPVRTHVHKKASIGAGAVILPGITVGQNAMIGAGAVVTRSVPPNAIVVGNPARIVGYVDSKKTERVAVQRAFHTQKCDVPTTRVRGAGFSSLPTFDDLRGSLAVADVEGSLPFKPKRFFVVYGVPSEEVRGEHAHRKCHQFLICVRGSVKLVLDDGTTREEVMLDHPSFGVHISPMVWATQYGYSKDAVLLVFASESYDAADYIRNYDDWSVESASNPISGQT